MADEIAGYRAGTPTVDRLLSDASVTLAIPVFQRSYSWTNEKVDELIGDLFEYDERWLSGKTQEDPYVLGALVLAGDQVLDGQQRLATISLLLAVLRQRLSDMNLQTKQIDACLSSEKLGFPTKHKLNLQPEDQKIFEALLADPRVASDPSKKGPNRRHLLIRATRRIIEAVDGSSQRKTTGLLTVAKSKGLSAEDAVQYLAQRVLYGVWFVSINATSETSAFRLFETLNDRGLDLSAADLVKNKLFAQSGELLPQFQEVWKDLVDDVRDEVVDFLRHFWIAFHSFVRKDELYDKMRQTIERKNSAAVLKLAEEMRDAAELYRSIVRPDKSTSPWDEDTAAGLVRLNAFRARSCRSALLAVAVRYPALFSELVEMCETLTVRYSLVGDQNPNRLEKAYSDVAEAARGANDPAVEIVKVINAVMPDDPTFVSNFSALEIEPVGPSWRQVLARLNDEGFADGETQVASAKKVHVEHVFPQSPSADALVEAGVKKDDDVGAIARRIGNLTLLLGAKNQAASNLPFSKKRPILATSKVAMNETIAKKSDGTDRDNWGPSEVDARSDELANKAAEVWRWPRT